MEFALQPEVTVILARCSAEKALTMVSMAEAKLCNTQRGPFQVGWRRLTGRLCPSGQLVWLDFIWGKCRGATKQSVAHRVAESPTKFAINVKGGYGNIG